MGSRNFHELLIYCLRIYGDKSLLWKDNVVNLRCNKVILQTLHFSHFPHNFYLSVCLSSHIRCPERIFVYFYSKLFTCYSIFSFEYHTVGSFTYSVFDFITMDLFQLLNDFFQIVGILLFHYYYIKNKLIYLCLIYV